MPTKKEKEDLNKERGNRMAKNKEEMNTHKGLIPLSQTTLDLILGGGRDALGIYPNDILNLVGDTGTGKTAVYTQMLYEIQGFINAGLSEEYSSVSHTVRDTENGNKFNTLDMFGFELNRDTDTRTIEEGFCKTSQVCTQNKKKNKGKLTGKNLHIEIYDSLDGFSSNETEKRGEDRIKAYEGNKDYKEGSFLLSKNKYLSAEFFPSITGVLQGADVLLIIVSQTREKIGVSFGSKIKITGGKALEFYCTYRVLIAEAQKIKRTVKGTPFDIGKLMRFKTLKVRNSKPYRTCYSASFFEFGMDDVFSNVLYVYDLITDTGQIKDDAASKNLSWEGTAGESELKKASKENIYEFLSEWKEPITGLKKSSSKKVMMEFIDADDDLREAYEVVFGSGMGIEELVQYIYEHKLEDDLREMAYQKWDAIESELAIVGRRRRW
jgi:RecA/RadA recombinase